MLLRMRWVLIWVFDWWPLRLLSCDHFCSDINVILESGSNHCIVHISVAEFWCIFSTAKRRHWLVRFHQLPYLVSNYATGTIMHSGFPYWSKMSCWFLLVVLNDAEKILNHYKKQQNFYFGKRNDHLMPIIALSYIERAARRWAWSGALGFSGNPRGYVKEMR